VRGDGEHLLGFVDADDGAGGADLAVQQRRTQPGAAADVKDGVPGPQRQRRDEQFPPVAEGVGAPVIVTGLAPVGRRCRGCRGCREWKAPPFPDCGNGILLSRYLRFQELIADLLRRPVPVRRVETLPIVAQFDIACNITHSLFAGRIDCAIHKLFLEGREERLGRSAMPLN
jgi:hypothetical protein